MSLRDPGASPRRVPGMLLVTLAAMPLAAMPLAAMLLAALPLAAVPLAGPAGASPPPTGDGPGRRVVYLSNRESPRRSFDLLLFDASSRSTVNLTRDRRQLGVTSLAAPRLLPDGSSAVLLGSAGRRLVSLHVTTLQSRPIADVRYEATQFDISPDGRFVLYTEKPDSLLQLFEAEISSGATRNLSANPWNNAEASYSPDGARIVFVCDRDGSRSIAIMDRDGRGQRLLTNNFGDDRSPRFSPDGRRIVFTSSRSATSDGQYDLYLIDTSGADFRLFYSTRPTGQTGPTAQSGDGRQTGQEGARNESPSFSPDGRSVVFVSAVLTKKLSKVLLMDVATGKLTDVSGTLPYLSRNPSFSPDGRHVLFENNTIADCEIMLYDIAEGALQNLSRNGSWDCSPSF